MSQEIPEALAPFLNAPVWGRFDLKRYIKSSINVGSRSF
jgi:hypothetical protein